MPYGFFIRNGASRTVIDENSYTLQVLREGTLTNWSDYLGDSKCCPIGRNDPNSLFFFRNSTGKAVSCPLYLNGRTGWHILSNNTAAIEFVEVVPSNYFSRSPGTYGLEVYDGSGALTFTSARDLVARGDRYSSNFSSGTGYEYPTQSFTTPAAFNWWCPMGKAYGSLRHPTSTAGSGRASYRVGYYGAVMRTSTGYRAEYLESSYKGELGFQSQATYSWSPIHFMTARGL